MEGCIVLNKLQFTFLNLFQIYQQDIIARNFIDGYGKKQIYHAGATQCSFIMKMPNPTQCSVVVIVKRRKKY